MLSLLLMPSTVGAEYKSHSDTEVEVFDYIENRRREIRDHRLTPEQIKLLQDVEEAKEQLPHPDLETEQVPAVFEGADLVYHTETGEFIAQGKVDILQLEGRRFQTDKATGNVIEKTVSIQGRAHVLQVVNGQPRITLDGYRTFYNYGTSASVSSFIPTTSLPSTPLRPNAAPLNPIIKSAPRKWRFGPNKSSRCIR